MKIRCPKCGRYFRETCKNCFKEVPKKMIPLPIKGLYRIGDKVRCINQDAFGVGTVTGIIDNRIWVEFRKLRPMLLEKSKLAKV